MLRACRTSPSVATRAPHTPADTYFVAGKSSQLTAPPNRVITRKQTPKNGSMRLTGNMGTLYIEVSVEA